MNDRVLARFLEVQREEAMALAAESDLLEITPLEPVHPQRYLVRLACRGLVRSAGGPVREAEGFVVGITFTADHLRAPDPSRVISLLDPRDTWHPNVRAPFVCLGHVPRGTGIVDLVYRAHEVLTYQRVTMNELDALNHEACSWARRNQQRFPLDTRALRRRSADLDVAAAEFAR